jgi:hypothetical protein
VKSIIYEVLCYVILDILFSPEILLFTLFADVLRRVLMRALLQGTHQLPSTNLLKVLVQIVNKLG